MLESKGSVLVIAGLFFFALAFVSNALVPAMMYKDLPEKTAEQLVTANLRYQFEDLARRFPASFEKHMGKPPEDAAAREKWLNEKCAEALRIGRKVYVGEACWHCHSQFVRPVSNESRRWGPVSKSWEYQNELQRPVMFGTRRVGPDLSREGGRRSNDWQATHLFKPTLLSDGSVMPEYPWFFEGAPDKPNLRGLALMTYLQWLGSWLESYPYYEQYTESSLPADAAPGAVAAAAGDAPAAGEAAADGDAAEPAKPDAAADTEKKEASNAQPTDAELEAAQVAIPGTKPAPPPTGETQPADGQPAPAEPKAVENGNPPIDPAPESEPPQASTPPAAVEGDERPPAPAQPEASFRTASLLMQAI
ncbi:MAG: cbb3-type cytochrome c oxidase subunit II [Planctomycetota bacterium]|nr:cbb3-type cytochrome c oxidase subunit II [Planctomycetota bacterium]